MAPKKSQKSKPVAKKNPYTKVFSARPLEDHVQDYKKQQEAFAAGGNKSGSSKFPVYLDIEEGNDALIRFLEKDPIKFWQHRVFDPLSKKGQGGFRVFSCTRDANCPLCKAGHKPTFKVAWQIVHVDHVDKTGKKPVSRARVKMLVKGIRFAEYHAKKTAAKKDITKCNVTLERIGSGQNTQYLFADWSAPSKIDYDKDELIDLEEYFGLDDEKFADMERIAEDLDVSAPEYSDKKQGKRSRLEDGDDLEI